MVADGAAHDQVLGTIPLTVHVEAIGSDEPVGEFALTIPEVDAVFAEDGI